MDVRARLREWYFVPLLFFVAAIAYLPYINKFGYFRDDWYLMYSANAMGASAFNHIFAIDRPFRGFLFSLEYSIFGLNPIFYNVFGYIFRVLGALAFLWTLRIIWPDQKRATMLSAMLYLIFPGFLSSPNAIDFQPHQIGLFFAHLSVALSVRAVYGLRPFNKGIFWLLSGLLTIMYLGLVEHFFGVEFFRIAAIFLVTRRRNMDGGFFNWVASTISHFIPFSVGSALFAYWRFFIFESSRKATDLGAQLIIFFESPLLIGINWVDILLKDVFEIVILAWVVPFSNLWDTPLRLRELFYAGILVLLSLFAVSVMLRMEMEEEPNYKIDQDIWFNEAFWLGLISVVTGFIPVILSNRNADLGSLSRYMLASISGAVVILAAFVNQLNSARTRYLMICLLVTTSVLTHYYNGVQWARSSELMKNFWWQVSWRIPQLEVGTTLVANYSHAAIEEDYFVWGPANLLYRPQSMSAKKIRPAIWALVLTREGVNSILANSEPEAVDRRTILTFMDYGNILVVTQPTTSSCVQVLDGRSPSLSEYEQDDIRLIASESNQKHILLNEQTLLPPANIFGAEPEHTWCYYYESASLAYQRGDWNTVLALGEEAQKMGFSAEDSVEWMPFIQAAVYLDDRNTVFELAPKVKKNSFLAPQACEILRNLPNLDLEKKDFVEDVFCR
ncbi:MAG: hypothetical protein JNM02_02375 [Anaerolineales bacterium]|nr:hypothetical protein [Anaerolineales bacterium]